MRVGLFIPSLALACSLADLPPVGVSAGSVPRSPIETATAHGDAFDVAYVSPSRGLLTFGWHEPLTVDGVEVPLRHQDRFDNPFVRAPFDARRYEIVRGEDRLGLEFTTGERSATPP